MPLTADNFGRRLRRVSRRAQADRQNSLSPQVEAYLKGEPTMIVTDTRPNEDGSELDERRANARVAMNDEVVVRRLGGFNFEVALRDLSSGGCRVEMLEPAEAGDSAVARLPKLEPLGARVRWAEGTTTGLQFHTTIHPAVFEQLLTRMTQDTAAAA
jgi:hypothetical protein